MQALLGLGGDVIVTTGGGKAKPTGKIAIATMQSLSRKGEVNALVQTVFIALSIGAWLVRPYCEPPLRVPS